MQSGRIIVFAALVLATAMPSFASSRARRGPTSHHVRRHGARTVAVHHLAGPRTMDSDRATEIQAALIKSGYLTGTPSGHWDAASQAAMQKLQADNGWQTKLTPDSRALIKLGLGPKDDVAETSALPSVASQSSGQLLPSDSTEGAQP